MMKSLGKAIANAPVAGDLPRLNGVVGPSDPDLVHGFVPVFRDVGSGWLNGSQFVSAARHQHALFSVPVPVVAKSSMRHWIGRRPKFGILPALSTVGGYFYAAYGASTGPRQAADFVEATARQLLSSRR